MASKTLDDLFHDGLKDLYYAERRQLNALKKMAAAVQSPALREAFLDHRDQTETHIDRLDEIFHLIGESPRSKTCAAIDGIIKGADEIMTDYEGQPALDAGLLAGAQAAEHYEIARYGTLRNWAMRLGLRRAAEMLDRTLEEEEDTDRDLTEIAASGVNQRAVA